jgi:bifunctional N-acetylglucosamine-1-phosphate-uridyltransferase/glucosamine-1-phosphate-acetyltransferase GlmU-like protein
MKLKTMLNIIIPVAKKKLDDSSVINNYPDMLTDISGKALIEYVIENINKIRENVKFIFIVNEEECDKYHIDNTLKLLTPEPVSVKIKGETRGAICSMLMAIDKIDEESELIILNADQVIDVNYNIVLSDFREKNADGGAITFTSVHPRWSFARIIENKIVETAEKNPISNNAIAGFYYFKRAADFINGSFDVMKYNDNYQGNYYTSSVFNQMILNNKFITAYNISSDKYHSFYSPQKLKEFEEYLKK